MRKRGLVKTKEKGKEKRFTASIGRASLPGPCADDEGKKKEEEGELIPLHTRTRLLTQTTDGGGEPIRTKKKKKKREKKERMLREKERGKERTWPTPGRRALGGWKWGGVADSGGWGFFLFFTRSDFFKSQQWTWFSPNHLVERKKKTFSFWIPREMFDVPTCMEPINENWVSSFYSRRIV